MCSKLAALSDGPAASSMQRAGQAWNVRACRRASSLTHSHELQSEKFLRRREKSHKRTDSSRRQTAGRRIVAQATPSYPSHLQQHRQPSNLFYFATCHPGLEEVVAAELASPNIRATNVSLGKAGVSFSGGDIGTGYRANLWLRSAVRVLQLLAADTLDPYIPGGTEIYRATRQATDWARLLVPGDTFSVDARVGGCSDVPSDNLARTRVKDAICDAIKDARNDKPMPPADGQVADLPLFITCFQDRFLLYRDMSGASLHQRGYRAAMHRASLNESAAAGILGLAGWPQAVAADPGAVLADPMCGSGTFLIEGALMARHVAPGLFRREWPFEWWPDFDATAWGQAQEEARAAERPWNGQAMGCDVHEGALQLAARDSKDAGVSGNLQLRLGSTASWQLQAPPSVTVVNPPWGQRLMNGEFDGGKELGDAWQELATFFKGQCNDSNVFVLSGSSSRMLTQQLRMKADWKRAIVIGGVDTRLLKYSVLPRLTQQKYEERGAMSREDMLNARI